MRVKTKLRKKEAELLKKCIPLTKDALNISVNGGEALTPAQQYAMGNEIKNASQGSNGNYSVNFGEGGTTATVTNNNTGKTTTVAAKDSSQTNYSGVGNGPQVTTTVTCENSPSSNSGNSSIGQNTSRPNISNYPVNANSNTKTMSEQDQNDFAMQHKNGISITSDLDNYGNKTHREVETTYFEDTKKIRVTIRTKNADGTYDNSEGNYADFVFDIDYTPPKDGDSSKVKDYILKTSSDILNKIIKNEIGNDPITSAKLAQIIADYSVVHEEVPLKLGSKGEASFWLNWLETPIDIPEKNDNQEVDLNYYYNKNKDNKLLLQLVSKEKAPNLDNPNFTNLLNTFTFNNVTNKVKTPEQRGDPILFNNYYYYPVQFPNSPIDNPTGNVEPWQITGWAFSDDMNTFGPLKLNTDAQIDVETYDYSDGAYEPTGDTVVDMGYQVHTGEGNYTWGCMKHGDDMDILTNVLIYDDYKNKYQEDANLYVGDMYKPITTPFGAF